ncbi:E3 SUMO-protein ligase PIAS2-like isoform X9 [Scylla paramamosain]
MASRRQPSPPDWERMVMTFRVSELQMLLGYAGKNKTGRKNELQSRAMDIVRLRNPAIQAKIKELYKSIQLEMMSFGDRSQAAAGGPAGILPAQKVPLGLNSIASYTQPASVGGIGGVTSTLASSRYSTNSQVVASGISSAGGYSSISANSHNSTYPINPDVKLKKLPFYDILGELLKPSSLAPQNSGRYQESTFAFSLTPHQANKIANSRDLRPGKQDYTVQVQMRFCLLETTCEQEDNFPPNIAVKINDKMCPLPTPIPTNKPGVEPKRPSRPVNVTALCRISPTVTNRIQVSWASEYGRCYVISVYLVQKLNSDDLLQRLKNRGAKIADFTRSLIKQKLQEDADCEIATTSLRCSLMCPLGKMRMMLPCRASTCDHLQCFDASLYLQMNERKPTWTCPVCDKTALYDCLVIDGYFQEVLQQNSSCNEVTLHKDGSWTPLMPKKEQKEPEVEKRKPEVAVETLSDDSDDYSTEQDDAAIVEEVSTKKKAVDPEIITLSDSDDNDEDTAPPPSKRSNTGHNSASSSSGASGSGAAGSTTPHGSEGTKSNDSWCVGEVDPGKRLVFRKSLSSSSNGTSGLLTPAGGSSGGPAFSPPSSGSVSPQIICLDSPASSPSPPPRRPNQGSSPLPAGVSVTPVVSSSSSTPTPTSTEVRQVINVTSRSPPPASISTAAPSSTSTTISTSATTPTTNSSSESPVPHTTITLLPTSSSSSGSISSTNTNAAASFLSPNPQDPLAASSTFNMQSTSSAAAAAAAAAVAVANLTPGPYPLPPALQNLFNPLGIIPPTTVSGTLPFRPQDRYM